MHVFVALMAALAVAAAQFQPIPATMQDGHFLGSLDAPLWLEAFLDYECPDSAASWPTLVQLAKLYGPSQLLLWLRPFSLPYHHNSYLATLAGTVIYNANPDIFWLWVPAIFANQTQFYTAATANMTMNQVISGMGKLAESIGMDYTTFMTSMQDPNMDTATRIQWKFGAGRGVFGTPQFYLNGVLTEANQTWTIPQWQQLIASVGTLGATYRWPAWKR